MYKNSKSSFSKSTILVTLIDVTDGQAANLFKSVNCFFTKVGSLVNRYTVEVPLGQEDSVISQLKESPLVKTVTEHYLRGSKITPHNPAPTGRKKYEEYFS